MVHKDIETNVGTFLRELKSIKKGKQTRFVEKLSLQVECMGEEAIDLAISKAEFNL